MPSNQRQIIEQNKFTYFPLGKVFEKQRKTIEEQGKKQVEALEVLKYNAQKVNNQRCDSRIYIEWIS